MFRFQSRGHSPDQKVHFLSGGVAITRACIVAYPSIITLNVARPRRSKPGHSGNRTLGLLSNLLQSSLSQVLQNDHFPLIFWQTQQRIRKMQQLLVSLRPCWVTSDPRPAIAPYRRPTDSGRQRFPAHERYPSSRDANNESRPSGHWPESASASNQSIWISIPQFCNT